MHTKDMVLKKRLDYGVNGCGFPVIPRGPRSRRVSHKKNIEDSQICAFELLADVAGKLLQESESSASSNAAEEKDPFGIQCVGFKKEKKEEGKALTTECLDGGSCVGSSFLSELAAKRSYARSTLSELIPKDCGTVLERASIISSSDISKKAGDNVKLEIPDGQAAVKICCIKPEGSFPHCGELSSGYVDNGIERRLEAKEKFNHNSYFTATNTSTSTDKLDIRVNSCPLINSDSSVQLTSFRDSIRNASFLRHRNSTTVSNRDDDYNFTLCKRCKCNIRAFRPQSCGVYRRIRKSSASKYLKVIPKLKDCEFSNADGGMRHIFRNKRSLYTSDRIRRKGPFKKRKLFDGSSKHIYDREESSESISNTPEKGMKGDKSGSAMTSHKACGISSPFVGRATSFRSRDSHVKFSIKSFKVPELYIEVPETATVGSLKRTVMEAVAAILQEGLHVGVLLQGEKVQDDERTLLQTGISHNGNLDNLGFTLEPSSVIASPPMSLENPSPLLPYGTPQQLTRFVTSPTLESGFINASSDPLHVAIVDNHVTSNHELVPLATDLVADAEAPDSRALVPLPAARVEALAVVSMTQKAKKTEIVQRRTRRPFSVAEVEALVEAVETLGTGRWRDVKLHAFENADHRTYVDLKDKWKTLVHTASISPQQRRGEPVPQVLLDRVLCAHSCWSQNQSKQHNKNQAEPLQISTVLAGTV